MTNTLILLGLGNHMFSETVDIALCGYVWIGRYFINCLVVSSSVKTLNVDNVNEDPTCPVYIRTYTSISLAVDGMVLGMTNA